MIYGSSCEHNFLSIDGSLADSPHACPQHRGPTTTSFIDSVHEEFRNCCTWSNRANERMRARALGAHIIYCPPQGCPQRRGRVWQRPKAIWSPMPQEQCSATLLSAAKIGSPFYEHLHSIGTSVMWKPRGVAQPISGHKFTPTLHRAGPVRKPCRREGTRQQQRRTGQQGGACFLPATETMQSAGDRTASRSHLRPARARIC